MRGWREPACKWRGIGLPAKRWALDRGALRAAAQRRSSEPLGRTRREAAEKLADLIAKTSAGVPLAVRSWIVAGYAAHWLEDVARPRLKPATFMSYREMLRLHILPTLGRVKVQALRPDQVRNLLAARAAAGLSPRSVQIVHGTLRAMLA